MPNRGGGDRVDQTIDALPSAAARLLAKLLVGQCRPLVPCVAIASVLTK